MVDRYLSDIQDALKVLHIIQMLHYKIQAFESYQHLGNGSKRILNIWDLNGPANDSKRTGIFLWGSTRRSRTTRNHASCESYLKVAQRIGDVLAVAQVFEFITQHTHERDDANVRLRYESALKEYKGTLLGRDWSRILWIQPFGIEWMGRRYCRGCLVATDNMGAGAPKWWYRYRFWQARFNYKITIYLVLRWEITR